MTMKGRFVWFDLNTTDPEGAIAFYGEVVGWGSELWGGGGEEPYTMWTDGDRSVGGVMELAAAAREMGAPPHWLGYLHTPDCDRAVAALKEKGGEVYYGPTDVETVGRFAVVGDPQGAVVGFYTPAGESPTPALGQPGNFSWAELMSSDPDASWAFYREMFDWKPAGEMVFDWGTYRMWGVDDDSLGGIMMKPDDLPNSAWLYYVTVDDVDAAIERVEANGGKIMNGPVDIPGGGRIAQCVDPQGAWFALHMT